MEDISVNVKASSGYIQLSYGHVLKDSKLVKAGKELVRAAKVEHYVSDVKPTKTSLANNHKHSSVSDSITYHVSLPPKLIPC
ncbi:hypothetical protein K493DRAFT_311807 [Basidiobolus meristosporus CBS 931.73]|uniref:Uncharacterized protein n=1 Tax=Basidiobolus meristosporus CBS 931.73 TaxID=1314790 RepID=A0A1Y1YZ22_9FUNG|nr:hypothetical protein K493DRAFT_311807 [Basidiobolus meristosporus CBS 931.73]|eukprot:ORY03186.1 hypothetical protein K493DRAFT_311807 [Basidiobolus meristosporus CBS 931.73]